MNKSTIFAKYHPLENHLARAEWTKLRRDKYYERIQQEARFNWERDLSADIVQWANHQFEVIIKDRHAACVDNFRVARISKPSAGKSQYKSQLRRGCCGFYDTVMVGPDGHTYRLGFNYGH